MPQAGKHVDDGNKMYFWDKTKHKFIVYTKIELEIEKTPAKIIEAFMDGTSEEED